MGPIYLRGGHPEVDVVGSQFQPCEALGKLGAAEPLVDQDFRVGCFEQGRVPSTARSQMRDGHRHANTSPATREGLEYTASRFVNEGIS